MKNVVETSSAEPFYGTAYLGAAPRLDDGLKIA